MMDISQLLSCARQARRENRPADARRDLVQAVVLCREAGAKRELAIALASLGHMERELDNRAAAIGHYEEAAAIYRAEGDTLGLAHTIRHVGDIHRDEGRVKIAEPFYDEALALYRNDEHTPPLDLANAIRGLALVKEEAGELGTARLLWQEARDLYAAVSVKAGVDESSRRLSRLSAAGESAE